MFELGGIFYFRVSIEVEKTKTASEGKLTDRRIRGTLWLRRSNCFYTRFVGHQSIKECDWWSGLNGERALLAPHHNPGSWQSGLLQATYNRSTCSRTSEGPNPSGPANIVTLLLSSCQDNTYYSKRGGTWKFARAVEFTLNS